MHIELYKALRGAKVADDAATKVVKSTEEFIAVKISEANKSLEAQMKALDTKINTVIWLYSALGILVTIIGLAPAYLRL